MILTLDDEGARIRELFVLLIADSASQSSGKSE
jgi:hypothetical protein